MSRIVGILNVTPDSFAEARPTTDPDAAVAAATRLLEDGADVIDVGAESTRPRAEALTADEEWSRLAPCLARIVRLAEARGVPVSLDTRHAATAARGLDAGVSWVNDVSGVGEAMAAVLAPAGCTVVVMHAVTVPVDPSHRLAPDIDVVAHLTAWFAERIETLADAGIAPHRLVLDPGIGFGTSRRQAIELVARAPELAALGRPLCVGHSRKSFLTLFADRPAPERDDVTLALSAILFAHGVDYVRVHDVARHVALRTALALPSATT